MANTEELLEEVNASGNGDSFGMVKRRFKDRSLVLSNLEFLVSFFIRCVCLLMVLWIWWFFFFLESCSNKGDHVEKGSSDERDVV